MSSSISVSFRVVWDEIGSKMDKIDHIEGLKIEKNVLTVTGAIEPKSPILIGESRFRVSPAQNILLEMINRFQCKSLTFLYNGNLSTILKNTSLSHRLGSDILILANDRIKVKEGEQFIVSVVLLTTILQNEHVPSLGHGKRMRDDTEVSKRTRRSMKFQEDVLFRILCPVSRVSSLIGKGGENIKEIGHKSSAFVTVLTEAKSYQSKRIVEVVGSGRKMMNLRDPTSSGSYAQMGLVLVADNIMEAEGEYKASILTDSLSKDDVQQLSESGGAEITFKKAPSIANDCEAVIKIRGTRSEVHKGLVSVSTLIQQKQLSNTTV